MRLGIMQPYFFPHPAYFALIATTERWVVFDVTQYTPKTWMNRNRVLHPTHGWMYVTVPLRNSSQSIAIRDAHIVDARSAHRTVLGKLSHYRRAAPHYHEVVELVNETFARVTDNSLVGLNVAAMTTVCRYLEVDLVASIWSEAGSDLPEIAGPGDWAPAICSAMGATEYVNPIGGRELFDPDEFARNSVALWFLEMTPIMYDTGPYIFEPGLSILDALMWLTPEEVMTAIRENTKLVSA